MATVEEIKTWLDRADAAEAEVEDLRWKAAEGLFLANKAGGGGKKTQDQLAAEIGRDQSTVSKYIWCWITYGPTKPGEKPKKPWAEAWREATGKRPEPRPNRATTPGQQPGDSPGNTRGADPDPIAQAFSAAWRLTESDPQTVVESVTDEKYKERLEWAEHVSMWVSAFLEALEARFHPEHNADDPVMVDSSA